MTPVGGSRHYQGAGLGDTLTWGCPSCGADNTGPISQGCQLCGAGKPGQRVSERAPDDPTYRTPPPPPPQDTHAQGGQGDVADYWASQQDAGVTLAEAYRAGYRDGVQAARATQQPPPEIGAPDAKITRTIIAALALFRDQVLAAAADDPDPEWLTAAECNLLIRRLQLELEVTHA